MRQNKHLFSLVSSLRSLPGVGLKTAQRYAFHLLSLSQEEIANFCLAITEAKQALFSCDQCGCLIEKKPCQYCSRDSRIICIVESTQDVFLLEELHFLEKFFVFGSLLSPYEDESVFKKRFNDLRSIIEKSAIEELIIALDATLEGDATALYLKKHLEDFPVKLTRLASGIPLGSSLQYTDKGTLTYALQGRQSY